MPGLLGRGGRQLGWSAGSGPPGCGHCWLQHAAAPRPALWALLVATRCRAPAPQVDVDITSNTVANSVTSLVVGAITSLVVDLAPLVEGQVSRGGARARRAGPSGACARLRVRPWGTVVWAMCPAARMPAPGHCLGMAWQSLGRGAVMPLIHAVQPCSHPCWPSTPSPAGGGRAARAADRQRAL